MKTIFLAFCPLTLFSQELLINPHIIEFGDEINQNLRITNNSNKNFLIEINKGDWMRDINSQIKYLPLGRNPRTFISSITLSDSNFALSAGHKKTITISMNVSNLDISMMYWCALFIEATELEINLENQTSIQEYIREGVQLYYVPKEAGFGQGNLDTVALTNSTLHAWVKNDGEHLFYGTFKATISSSDVILWHETHDLNVPLLPTEIRKLNLMIPNNIIKDNTSIDFYVINTKTGAKKTYSYTFPTLKLR